MGSSNGQLHVLSQEVFSCGRAEPITSAVHACTCFRNTVKARLSATHRELMHGALVCHLQHGQPEEVLQLQQGLEGLPQQRGTGLLVRLSRFCIVLILCLRV